MRLLWTLAKVLLALVLIIPVAMIVLATTLGILGTLFGVVILATRIAIVGLIGWGAFRLFSALMRGPAPRPRETAIPELRPVDRHYEAAMRELDQELGV